MAHDVFISYSTKDKHIADAVCAKLESSGIRCWIAPRDIRPGDNWVKAINDAISESRVMVLVFSANTNSSQTIEREVGTAIQKEVCIIPFRIENVLPSGALEFQLRVTHWLDALTPPMEKHLQSLTHAVKTFLGQKKPEKIYPQSEEITKKQHIKTKGFNKLIFIGGVLAALTVIFLLAIFVKEKWHYGSSENTKKSIFPSSIDSSSKKTTATTPVSNTPTLSDKSDSISISKMKPAAGFVRKDIALNILRNFKLGIYFHQRSKELSNVANDIRNRLIQYGFKREQILLYGKDDLFFEDVVLPNGFEIRYETGYEDNEASVLNNILIEIYPSGHFQKQIVEAGRTENFISIFLGESTEQEKASPSTSYIQQKEQQNIKAGYSVGLVSFGVSTDEFERVQKEILAEGYRQHDINVHLTQRTTWLAARPTVLYYDRGSESMAKMLAEKMEKLSGLKFSIQFGAGLGVTKGEEFSTLFIHYIRE